MPDASPVGRGPSLIESLQGLGARLAAHVPGQLLLRLLGQRPHVVDGRTLDPHVQLVRTVRLRQHIPALTGTSVGDRRTTYRIETASVTGSPTPVGGVRDLAVEGATGMLPARL
jgi:acetyl esterase